MKRFAIAAMMLGVFIGCREEAPQPTTTQPAVVEHAPDSGYAPKVPEGWADAPDDAGQSCCTTDNDYISFVAVYTVKLKDERVLKVKAISRPWLAAGDIEFVDEIRQKDKRWVIFDCNHIADRILIPGLPQELAPHCASVHAQAERFWKSTGYKPDEFVDNQGTRWRKVK